MKYFIIPFLILGAWVAYLYLKPSPIPSTSVVDPIIKEIKQQPIVLPFQDKG